MHWVSMLEYGKSMVKFWTAKDKAMFKSFTDFTGEAF